jgi:MarR family transcriptional regulator, organic hydroperoxide resistance regulator
MTERDQGSIGWLLGRVFRLHFIRSQELLGPLGIYAGQEHIFFPLAKRGERTQNELAEIMGRRPATVAVMLKRMEKAGFIERTSDEKDRRVTRVRLTGQGTATAAEIRTQFGRLNRECFEGFSEEEKATLAGYLKRMGDNLASSLSRRSDECVSSTGEGAPFPAAGADGNETGKGVTDGNRS